jgi:hypothetical protein
VYAQPCMQEWADAACLVCMLDAVYFFYTMHACMAALPCRHAVMILCLESAQKHSSVGRPTSNAFATPSTGGRDNDTY